MRDDPGDKIDREERLRLALRRQLLKSREDSVTFVETIGRQEGDKPIRMGATHVEWQRTFDEHDRVVLFAPVGHGKSSQITRWRLLFEMGRNPNIRIGVISVSKSGVPTKFLSAIKADIERNKRLRLVFPNLRPSTSGQRMWGERGIIIERTDNVPDPTIQMFGLYGKILGSRLDLIVIDDICNMENTLTEHSREKMWEWVSGEVLSRLPRKGGRVWAVGHVWHREDVLHRLSRISTYHSKLYSAFVRNPNTGEEEPLIPELWTLDRLYEREAELGRLAPYMLRNVIPMYDDARIKQAWVERCLERGRGRKLEREWNPADSPTFTGVDLSVASGKRGDLACLFTITILPDGSRLILDVRSGRWTGPRILEELIDVYRRFGSIIMVESNAAQDYLAQFAGELTALPLKRHYCVDTETEVLSRRGWLRSHEVGVGDEIYTLNTGTGRGEWKLVNDVYRSDYSGPMYRFESTSIDALCTPDHKWPRTDQKGSPLTLTETRDLNTNSVIPRGRPADYDPSPTYSTALVELVGWAVTEGHYPRGRRIVIGQSPTANPHHVASIRALLDRVNAKWTERDNGSGTLTFSVQGEIADTIRGVTGPGKDLPLNFVLALSREQRLRLLDVLVNADGWVQGRTRYLCSNTPSILDAFELLCALEGFPTGRTYRTFNGKQHGVVSQRVTRDTYLQNKGTRPKLVEQWSGEIWCPSTENGTFLARRNGVTYFTGNTGVNKRDWQWGIESLGTEFQQAKWIIPCDTNMVPTEEVAAWIREATSYVPTEHTGDRLMASWIAREAARSAGYGHGTWSATADADYFNVDSLSR